MWDISAFSPKKAQSRLDGIASDYYLHLETRSRAMFYDLKTLPHPKLTIQHAILNELANCTNLDHLSLYEGAIKSLTSYQSLPKGDTFSLPDLEGQDRSTLSDEDLMEFAEKFDHHLFMNLNKKKAEDYASMEEWIIFAKSYNLSFRKSETSILKNLSAFFTKKPISYSYLTFLLEDGLVNRDGFIKSVPDFEYEEHFFQSDFDGYLMRAYRNLIPIACRDGLRPPIIYPFVSGIFSWETGQPYHLFALELGNISGTSMLGSFDASSKHFNLGTCDPNIDEKSFLKKALAVAKRWRLETS